MLGNVYITVTQSNKEVDSCIVRMAKQIVLVFAEDKHSCLYMPWLS